MRVSIATCQDRVCPRFDRAASLVVIEVQGAREEGRKILDISAWPAHGRAARVAQLGVDQLICGALSSFDEAGFDESPVRLVPRVAGPVDAVIEAILSGAISPEQDYWQDRSDVRAQELQRRRRARWAERADLGHGTGEKGQDGSNVQKG
jgi:predicted Fe-Mo cluster-binding NifX family protein